MPHDTEQDPRPARRLGAPETADLCHGCVRCCTYITVEIDPPRAAWEYDQWVWALHHDGIGLVVERPERWFLHVETRCRKLEATGRCSIHGRHPVLCRDYDPRSCERRLPLADVRASFHDAEAFERWLEAERPAHWRQLVEFRRRAAAPGAAPFAATPALVSLESLAGAASRARGPAPPRRAGASRG